MTFRVIGGLILATIPMFVMVGINAYLTVKDWERRTKEIGNILRLRANKSSSFYLSGKFFKKALTKTSKCIIIKS